MKLSDVCHSAHSGKISYTFLLRQKKQFRGNKVFITTLIYNNNNSEVPILLLFNENEVQSLYNNNDSEVPILLLFNENEVQSL